MGKSAFAATAFNSVAMRATSAAALSSVSTPPQDFHDVACFFTGVLYINTACTLSGLPALTKGLSGSHRSAVHLRAGAATSALAGTRPRRRPVP